MAANNIYIQVDFNSANAQGNVNSLNSAIANTGTEAEKSSKKATASYNSVGVSIQNVNREFTALTSAMAGLGIARGIAGMVQISAELNRSQLAMQAFTGSVKEANEVFEQVRAIAATSPFRFKDLEETAQRLLGFGMAAKNVPDTLKVITDQVARMGGSIESVNGLVNLFGRIMEKDFVGAMDLVRKLPAEGVPALKALGVELSKMYGRAVDTNEVREAIKSGILTPLQTIRVLLDSMRAKGDASRFSDDAARAFKNLADTVDNVLGKLFGPQGFGPALTNLANEITKILSPLGGLIDMLMKLSPETKQLIVNWTAAAAAFALFGTALSIVTTLASPLAGLVKTLWSFTSALVAMNPELALAALVIGGLAYTFYKIIPEIKQAVDGFVGPLVDKLKKKLGELGEQGRKFFADAFKQGTPIDPGALVNTDDLFKKLTEEIRKHGAEAGRTLADALGSPADGVRLKYSTLLAELEEKMKAIVDEGQKKTLRDLLGGAESAEEAGVVFKQHKKELDELTRYQVEKAKGATDAQVAYIEAMDAQDLRGKVSAIDHITKLRMDGAQQVADIEKQNLRDQFDTFANLAKLYRVQFEAAGIDVNKMIEDHRKELGQKVTALDQKAFDESQKARLDGWKKANDAIIEDQKRVYDALKDQFAQLFDVFTDKTKSLGQALGDFFKKAVMGEARELFSSTMGGLATQAAGYGRPEESVARGGQGILGTLLRRGMPPRPPLPPPGGQEMPASVQAVTYTADTFKGGADNFQVATNDYTEATQIFARAVGYFADATQGSANRIQLAGAAAGAGNVNDAMTQAFQNASSATGVPLALLRAVARTESGLKPGAVSPKGAQGLMQLMPGTAAELGVTNPMDVGQNVMGGAQYLQQMLTRYKGDVPAALAAYNMGPAGYDRRMAAGRALPAETQAYVKRITTLMAAGTPPSTAAAVASGSADAVASDTTERFERASSGLPPPPSMMDLANLPMQGSPLSAGFGLSGLGSVTGPSVAELAALPQQSALQKSALAVIGGAALKNPSQLGKLGSLFGIGNGGTSFGDVAGSAGVAGLAGIAGGALLSSGLKRHNSPMTVAGGALSGVGAAASLGFAPLGGALLGAGAGLFMAGVQRGGALGLGMDVAGGALSGAMLGLRFGGPMGALIGAGVGAAVGAITGTVRLFVKTESERIRAGIKQVYGIDIANRQILTQIQQIVDQKYGGSVTVGIRSQEVQDIVRLYALSTGQAANLPRPMYAATIAESQAGGLATQPVYQGGVLVQNPYTGATTYQYQTAVTAAQGLMSGTSQGVPGAGNQVGNIFMQLNPQQANDLFTGRVVQAVQQNPAAIAAANANGTRAGDSRVTQASNMLEPLTSLS